jgi:hypothetical protein
MIYTIIFYYIALNMGKKIIFGQCGYKEISSIPININKVINGKTHYIAAPLLIDIDDIQSCKYINDRYYELIIKDDGIYQWIVDNALKEFEQQFLFFPYKASQPPEIILRLQKLEKENAMLLSHIETLLVSAGLRAFDADPL